MRRVRPLLPTDHPAAAMFYEHRSWPEIGSSWILLADLVTSRGGAGPAAWSLEPPTFVAGTRFRSVQPTFPADDLGGFVSRGDALAFTTASGTSFSWWGPSRRTWSAAAVLALFVPEAHRLAGDSSWALDFIRALEQLMAWEAATEALVERTRGLNRDEIVRLASAETTVHEALRLISDRLLAAAAPADARDTMVMMERARAAVPLSEQFPIAREATDCAAAGDAAAWAVLAAGAPGSSAASEDRAALRAPWHAVIGPNEVLSDDRRGWGYPTTLIRSPSGLYKLQLDIEGDHGPDEFSEWLLDERRGEVIRLSASVEDLADWSPYWERRRMREQERS